MLSNLLLSFREGFEASLVIGIILAYLIQTDQKRLSKFVYFGALLGFIVSLVGGFIGFSGAKELGKESEDIFKGVMMLMSSVLIAYFVVWMGNQASTISAGIKEKVKSNSNAIGLFTLGFLSVFREGLELVIFTLTKISEKASNIALGSALGIVFAIILAYIIFKSSIRFNIKLIFKVLGLILIFIGAEMFSEGILKFVLLDDVFEIIFMALFIIPSLYFFLRSDNNYLKNHGKQ